VTRPDERNADKAGAGQTDLTGSGSASGAARRIASAIAMSLQPVADGHAVGSRTRLAYAGAFARLGPVGPLITWVIV
jgi:hypothetical protein